MSSASEKDLATPALATSKYPIMYSAAAQSEVPTREAGIEHQQAAFIKLAYRALVDDLYFLFHEGPADRLQGHRATAFSDIGSLRTELRHDTDHGKPRRVRAKRKKAGHTFKKYSGASSPVGLPPRTIRRGSAQPIVCGGDGLARHHREALKPLESKPAGARCAPRTMLARLSTAPTTIAPGRGRISRRRTQRAPPRRRAVRPRGPCGMHEGRAWLRARLG